MLPTHSMMDPLLPFQYEFFRHGLLAALLVGAVCGFIGVYVVLRRMSYIGHGLAHAIFGGAVLSQAISINFFIGAGLWTLIAASLIHIIAHRKFVGADAAIGVVTTSSFAVGVAIVSTHRQFTKNIEAALFGNILGITEQDLWIIASISLFVFLSLLLIRRQLLFATFDPEVAMAYGVSTWWTDFFFVILLAITVLASTQILGVTLVAAAVVIPPVIARYLTKSFKTLLFVSPIIGALCSGIGIYLSFIFDMSSAAMIVLTSATLFLIVETGLLLRRKTGLS